MKTVHGVASVNMADITVAKSDLPAQTRVEEGSNGQLIKNYNITKGQGSIPLDTKTVDIVHQHQAWNL